MTEQLSTGATSGSVAGWGLITSALAGFITSVDYSITFGALADAICFVVTGLILFYGNFALLWLFGHYKASAWQATAVNLSKWRRSKYKYSIDLQRLLHIFSTKGRPQNTLVASNMKNHTLA
ncbi:hypothetical protein QZH36_09095 [Erwinia sp. BC051422]|uniref:hypothetical protein n=1 Tax=Erwinia wuhanensis TaxID=3045167 RepID=UPI0026515CB4|nr:hypothetical protein [Erwinia sp. BC051422]MDN8541596.1 hypothetical protein [Erwinia sp. BC051422]